MKYFSCAKTNDRHLKMKFYRKYRCSYVEIVKWWHFFNHCHARFLTKMLNHYITKFQNFNIKAHVFHFVYGVCSAGINKFDDPSFSLKIITFYAVFTVCGMYISWLKRKLFHSVLLILRLYSFFSLLHWEHPWNGPLPPYFSVRWRWEKPSMEKLNNEKNRGNNRYEEIKMSFYFTLGITHMNSNKNE